MISATTTKKTQTTPKSYDVAPRKDMHGTEEEKKLVIDFASTPPTSQIEDCSSKGTKGSFTSFRERK